MTEYFVTYEQAIELKELGFSEPCFAKFIKKSFQLNSLGGGNNYNNGAFGINIISAPLKQQALRWFRDKYNIDIENTKSCHPNLGKYYAWGIVLDDFSTLTLGLYDTYEQAESACIDKLIELIKNKKT